MLKNNELQNFLIIILMLNLAAGDMNMDTPRRHDAHTHMLVVLLECVIFTPHVFSQRITCGIRESCVYHTSVTTANIKRHL